MSGYILFLDDVRTPSRVYPDTFDRDWVVCKNFQEFTTCIRIKGLPQFVSFDHDLAEEHYIPENKVENYVEKTGYDCAKYLVAYCMDNNLRLPPWAVHSMNPVGAQNIRHVLNTFQI